MSDQKRQRYFNGLLAEMIAAVYLMIKGYKILKWRYKTPQGEIDLIAYDDDTLVFAEVKQRASIEEGLLSITPQMRARISRAALNFISANKDLAEKPMRFDFLAVKLPCTVLHLDNAWMGQ